jgi:hypothetical protein
MSLRKPTSNGIADFPYFPPWQDFCNEKVLNWHSGGLYSKSPGHWACFVDDQTFYPYGGFNEYNWGIGMANCLNEAGKWGVAPELQEAWCDGWPKYQGWGPILPPPNYWYNIFPGPKPPGPPTPGQMSPYLIAGHRGGRWCFSVVCHQWPWINIFVFTG